MTNQRVQNGGGGDDAGMSIGKFALLVAVLSGAGIFLYSTFFEGGFGGFSSIPKDMVLTYKNADFKPSNIDQGEALTVLSNPQRYRREFNDLVYNFNVDLLNHVANRMGMNENLKAKAVTEYDKHHPYLKEMYYNDFLALKDTTSNLYQTWYGNESANAVDLLNEVASKYTCFFVNQVMSTILKTENGKISVKGRKVDSPCGVALTEGLKPMISRLQQSASIRDFSASKGMMQERIEKAIAELATMEVRDKKGLNKQMQTKLMGYAVSSTDLEITAISILKVGFKLDQFFDISISSKDKTIVVSLPQPTILSHEVYPKVDKLDVGWLREVSGTDFNKNFNLLRSEFRKDALESDIMDKSKKRVVELMDMLMLPIVKKTPGYKLKIKFKKGPEVPLVDPDNPIDGPAPKRKMADTGPLIEDEGVSK